uniref:Retinoic acid receptor responder 1 n=1 Tax=Strix occidentalis caurina TaxID=311401 RepID=A0A8D0KUU6_STROC
MQGLSAAPPAAFLLLLLSALLSPAAAAPGAERELNPSGRLAAGAARVALHYLNFQAGSPGALKELGQVRKATLKVGGSRRGRTGRGSGENAGSCLATVLYRRTKFPPVVNIKCMHTKDQKQIQEEDNRLYQKIRQKRSVNYNFSAEQPELIIFLLLSFPLADSYGHIEPALEPAWALAVAGSSYIMWEKSTESLGYFLAQVKSVKQWVNDFIEFDYTVLLHEIPTQEIISCHMRLTWLPGHPLKVKYFCASENQGLEDGSGMESGSAAGILHGKGANF